MTVWKDRFATDSSWVIFYNKAKDVYALIVVICMVSLLSGCAPSIYSTNPYNYADSVWECKEANIFIEIKQPNQPAEDHVNNNVYRVVDGEKIPLHFYTYGRTGVAFVELAMGTNRQETTLCEGTAICGETDMRITNNPGTPFADEFPELTFVRIK